MRCISLAASKECPPRSKKFCRTPIGFLARISSQIFTNCDSTSSVGATKPSPAASRSGCGIGRARRSNLPLGVNGNELSTTNVGGTMYSGNFLCRKARSSAAGGAPRSGTMKATRQLPPV